MVTGPSALLTTLAAAAAPAPSQWGWRPFIDPMPVHVTLASAWLLLLPLALGIAIIYKAVRVPDTGTGSWWGLYLRQVAILSVQIVVTMLALAAATYLFVEVYVGWIADKAG